MSRAVTTKNYFTFAKGFNTEAGYLTFPENTAVDILNMNINTDFSLSRRLGMDYESSYSFNSVLGELTEPTIVVGSAISGSAAYYAEGVKVGSTIYGVPHSATTLLKINTVTGAYTQTGSVTAGSNKWIGGALVGTTIYCAPLDQTDVLKINTSNDTTSTLDVSLSGTNNMGSIIYASNGILYMSPSADNFGVRIDPDDDTFATLTGTTTGSSKRYRMGAEGNNGHLYFPPYQGTDEVLKINTSTHAQSLLTGVTTGVTDRFLGAVKSSVDGKIYCIPHDATFVLVIDPATDTVTSLGSGLSGADKWAGGYEDDDGIIWGVPATSKNLLKIDVANQTVTTVDRSAEIPAGATSYYGGVYANGRGYYIPYSENNATYLTHYLNNGTEVFTNRQCNNFIWNNPGNEPEEQFLVLQIGNVIHFHDLKASGSTSDNKKGFFITLDNYKAPNVDKAGEHVVDFDASNGILYIGGEDINPLYVEYDPIEDDITVTELTVNKRDRIGLDDGLDVDEEPTTLSNPHKYNLLNQGWDNDKITEYFNSQSKYPSNAQIWYQGKDSSDDFDPALLIKQDFGTTSAPRGRFIIDAFNPNRSTTSGVSGLSNTDSSDIRPASFCIFSGRMIMPVNGRIYISRVIDQPSDAGKFYSAADPTAEIDNEVADDDGFVLNLPEAGKILACRATEGSVLLASENGIWELTASDGNIFSPANVLIRKVTNIGILGTLKNMLIFESGIMFVSDGGLYILTPDQISGKLNAENISLETIQSFLTDTMSAAARKYSHLVYDAGVKQIHMLYRTATTYDGSDFRSAYDGILTLDLRKGAFFKHTLSRASTSPFVFTAFPLPNLKSQTVQDTVVVAGDTVEVSGDTVYVNKSVPELGSTELQYMVAKNTGTQYEYTFADFTDDDFVDWATDSQQSFSSYITTGYIIESDTTRSKDAPYLVMHMKRTEENVTESGDPPTLDKNSSCMVQYRWDWSDNANSNKWGTAFEAYRRNRYTVTAVGAFNDGYPVVTTQSRLRGSGRSLHLHFASSAGKDMRIIGWGLVLGSTTIPGTRGTP